MACFNKSQWKLKLKLSQWKLKLKLLSPLALDTLKVVNLYVLITYYSSNFDKHFFHVEDHFKDYSFYKLLLFTHWKWQVIVAQTKPFLTANCLWKFVCKLNLLKFQLDLNNLVSPGIGPWSHHFVYRRRFFTITGLINLQKSILVKCWGKVYQCKWTQ